MKSAENWMGDSEHFKVYGIISDYSCVLPKVTKLNYSGSLKMGRYKLLKLR